MPWQAPQPMAYCATLNTLMQLRLHCPVPRMKRQRSLTETVRMSVGSTTRLPKNIIVLASQSLAAAYNVLYCFSIPPAKLAGGIPRWGGFPWRLTFCPGFFPHLSISNEPFPLHPREFPGLQTNRRDSCSQSILFRGSSGRPLVWL
jgi:hypothetical protein